ncbi:lymphokine-activated killer T-cell-originated protein kinase-like [Asterias amurensis]|uniref:lymphokine-activated killer T-cell-originated protein kinase-like n=1 Tax=Asterias amurensis TaxID=7602 RepID=UPI003AB19D3F
MTNITSSAGKDLFLSPEPSNSRRMSRHSAGSSGCSVPRSSVSSCSFDSPSSTRACRVTASIPPSPFMQKLGCGTGVSVYLFQRGSDGTGLSPWAVKRTSARTQQANCAGNIPNSIENMLAKEARILKGLKHENIVGFRAFSRSEDGKLCLSMENGEKSLLDIIELRDEEGCGPFSASEMYEVALGLAKALRYLHSEKHLLHGDLKSGNVLVGGDFDSVKLCDFGVSLKLKKDLTGLEDSDEHYVGTEPWSAPEVINEEGPITDKADIFSYGLVLWEMMSLTIPHLECLGGNNSYTDESSIDESFQEAQYQAALGTRPPLPDFTLGTQYNPLISLFWACTEENPARRPSANLVVDALESISISCDSESSMDKENIPMDENL